MKTTAKRTAAHAPTTKKPKLRSQATDKQIHDKIDPFRNGGWTSDAVDKFTDEQTETIADSLGLLVSTITFGDFALAHRILVGLEKVATGKHPDLDTLCKNRGPRYFVEGPGADA